MTASGLADADLHGLVDGRVEPNRRAEILRMLAGSPADRALIEAWQDQGDLIREAFREVPAETLPVALDLTPPRLRSVDTTRIHSDRPHKGSAPRRRSNHGGGGAAIAAALVITIGLTMSWMAASRDDALAPAGARGSLDGDRTGGLPSFRVPDLSATGLRLTDVSSEAADPSTVVLRYLGGGARVALRVARNAPDIGPMPLERAGTTLTWRSPSVAFSLSGSVAPERLRAIAVALQASQGSD